MDLTGFVGREVHAVLRFFESDKLPAEVRNIADGCANLAAGIAGLLGDHPQLTAGMQHLLDAQAAFVRAASDQAGLCAPTSPITAPGPTGTLPVDPAPIPDPQTPVQPAPGTIGDSGPAGAGIGTPITDTTAPIMTDPAGVPRSPAEAAALAYAQSQGWEPAGVPDAGQLGAPRVPGAALGSLPPLGSPAAPFVAPVAAPVSTSMPGRDHPITQAAP